mgnify:CR=1 FL=1
MSEPSGTSSKDYDWAAMVKQEEVAQQENPKKTLAYEYSNGRKQYEYEDQGVFE